MRGTAIEERTRRLWGEQDRHPGDRERLFATIGEAFPIRRVLYPGSWVDVAASFVFDEVTYVDQDRRAKQFFADAAGVDELIAERRDGRPSSWQFVGTDYESALPLEDGSFDLLVSLYAGFVSEHCSRYLHAGGWLLANPSHGDVAMAALDPRYELVAVVQSRNGEYSVSDHGLDRYLVPKRETEIMREALHVSGRGISYTVSAFAYVFQRREA